MNFNFYKHSTLPQAINRKMLRHENRVPGKTPTQSYNRVGSIDILALHARADAKATSVWKRGYKDDRLEFIKMKKAEIGESLDRLLHFSSKRTTHAAVIS